MHGTVCAMNLACECPLATATMAGTQEGLFVVAVCQFLMILLSLLVLCAGCNDVLMVEVTQ